MYIRFKIDNVLYYYDDLYSFQSFYHILHIVKCIVRFLQRLAYATVLTLVLSIWYCSYTVKHAILFPIMAMFLHCMLTPTLLLRIIKAILTPMFLICILTAMFLLLILMPILMAMFPGVGSEILAMRDFRDSFFLSCLTQ